MQLKDVLNSWPLSFFLVGAMLFIGLAPSDDDPEDYATVNFEGGYQKIGVIFRQETNDSAIVNIGADPDSEDDTEIGIGDAIGIFQRLAERISKEDNIPLKEVTFPRDLKVDLAVSVSWDATDNDFMLTTDTLTLFPTKDDRILDTIKRMERFKESAREDASSEAESALTYSKNPNRVNNLGDIATAFLSRI